MKLQVLAPDPFAFRPMTRIAFSMANVGTLDLDFSKFAVGASGLLADALVAMPVHEKWRWT
jgi:hypothetical protein